MGVEPIRERLAPPTGFEVRPPHQGRFSSSWCNPLLRRPSNDPIVRIGLPRAEAKQIVGAHEMLVPRAPRKPYAIKEFENLDRPLATKSGGIPERRWIPSA